MPHQQVCVCVRHLSDADDVESSQDRTSSSSLTSYRSTSDNNEASKKKLEYFLVSAIDAVEAVWREQLVDVRAHAGGRASRTLPRPVFLRVRLRDQSRDRPRAGPHVPPLAAGRLQHEH